jgi:uncharacterized membrane protein YhaH (DUF805 family)
MVESHEASSKRGWWYLLLLIPFVVLSAVPLFNQVEPRLFGIPFFWWFQLMWIPLSAVLTAIVYFMTERNSGDGELR